MVTAFPALVSEVNQALPPTVSGAPRLSVATSPPEMYKKEILSGGKQLKYSILRQVFGYNYEDGDGHQTLAIPVGIVVPTGEVVFATPGKDLVKVADFTDFMVAFTELIAEAETNDAVVLESLVWNPIPEKNICNLRIQEIIDAGTGTALTYELHFAPERGHIIDKVKLDGITMHAKDDQGNPVAVPVSLLNAKHIVGGRSSMSIEEFGKVRAALATVTRTLGARVASGQGSFSPGGAIEVKDSKKDGTMWSPHAFRVGIRGFQVDGADRETLLLQWLFEACTVPERVGDKIVQVENGAGFHRYSKGISPRNWYGLHQTGEKTLFKLDTPFSSVESLLEYWLDHGFPT